MPAWNDYSVPQHMRDYRERDGVTVEVVSNEGAAGPESVVRVTFKDGFVFGNNGPFADAKDIACSLLRQPYSRMRVIDVVMVDERVRTLVVAYRKGNMR